MRGWHKGNGYLFIVSFCNVLQAIAAGHFAGGYTDDSGVGILLGSMQHYIVLQQQRYHCRKACSLIAIYKGVVYNEAFRQGCSLGIGIRIKIIASKCLERPGARAFKHATISDALTSSKLFNGCIMNL